MIQNIGFIGAGVMGKSMIRNLMKKGFHVTVYSRTKSKAEDLIAEGADWKDDAGSCAQGQDAVITIVGYPKDVEEVYFADNGILANAKKGAILIDMTTSSPNLAKRIYDAAKEKVLELAQLLTPWCGRLTVHVVPFTEIQEQIRMNCPEDHFTLIMRRFMMRLAQRVADEVRAKALVTGECLGQVASQTMEALRVSEDVVELPVLRPLIGMDKEEIIRISRKIGTFDTSILPYEDCCTVFTPRHPKTKPHVEEVRELEAVLDIDALCDRAMAGRERVRIKL